MSTLTCTVLLFIAALINNAAGACTFPSDIRGTWLSSDRGSLTFNSSHVVDYPVYNQGDLAFECYSLVGNYYILLSEEFTLFSSPAIAVMCVSFTSVKEYMYKYQIFTVALTDADNQRIRFAATGTTVNSALACTDLGATDYYLLMQDGQIESVKEQCPDIFLGTFAFSFNESDCANSTGSLNVCSDLDTMTFNYTTCSTQQAYSSNGSLNCLYSTTSGDVTTLNVYNLDSTTDESSTYRFTCYVIEQPSGSSNVYATQHPKDCHVNQTSTYVPAPGANLTMLASVTCVPTTTTTTTATTTAQAGLIAGVAAGLIVLLLLALLIVGFYCYKKKSKVQPAGKAPIDTGMRLIDEKPSKDPSKSGVKPKDPKTLLPGMAEESKNPTDPSSSVQGATGVESNVTVTALHVSVENQSRLLHDAVDIEVDPQRNKLPPLEESKGNDLHPQDAEIDVKPKTPKTPPKLPLSLPMQ